MVRVLITGARGFVGPHFAAAVARLLGGAAEIIATSKSGGEYPPFDCVLPLDVTDEAAAAALIAELKPTHVMNLAGIAAVMAAGRDPDAAWRVHLQGTLNLGRAILRARPTCWLLNVGTGLVYGDSANSGHPVDEATLLAPTDEYSASKAAADLALGVLARRGLRCVRLRPFNHIGPGQSEDFVVSSLAMQVACIEAGLSPPVIRIGNLNSQRDFLDVRDVADAYARVVKNSERLTSGLIINIASGVPRRIADILDTLIANCSVAVAVEHDPGRIRPNDLAVIIGNSCRARKLLDWTPCYDFEQTLLDILDYCRRVARARRAVAGDDHPLR